MTEGQEIRASHEEVEGFVAKLREFHGSLSESEQAMMDTVLDSAQGETGGYLVSNRSGDQDWNEIVDLLIDEDTQGFMCARGH